MRWLHLVALVLAGSVPVPGTAQDVPPCETGKIGEKREQLREQLKDLIDLETDTGKRVDLLLRLAGVQLAEAQACPARGDPWRERATKTYELILQKHPDNPRRHETMFALSACLWDLNRREEALRLHRSLIQEGSKYAPDAWLAHAEYYFDRGQLQKAIGAYQKVSELSAEHTGLYARYKLGWCYFNLQHFDRAMQQFEQVIRAATSRNKAESLADTSLHKEALRDYVLAYSHAGRPDRASKTFRRLAPGRARELMERLAVTYGDQGKFREAITIYRALLEHQVCSFEAPRHQIALVQALASLGLRQEVLREARELGAMLARLKRCAGRTLRRNRRRFSELTVQAEDLLADMALVWELECSKAPPQAFEQAEQLLRLFLELFPESDRAYDIRFTYAQFLHHKRELLKTAAEHYEAIVHHDHEALAYERKIGKKIKVRDKASAPGTHLCDAAYGACATRHRLQDPRRPQTVIDFVDAAEAYQAQCPDASSDWTIELARALLRLHHEEEAWNLMGALIREETDRSRAARARKLYNEIADRVARHPGLRLGAPRLEHGEVNRATLRGVLFANVAALEDCYAYALERNPDLSGWVLLRFVIAANGRVAMVKWGETNLEGQDLGRCVGLLVRRLRFPKPAEGGSVVVSYPFVFGPESAKVRTRESSE